MLGIKKRGGLSSPPLLVKGFMRVFTPSYYYSSGNSEPF
jgi:hypothetical protein